MPFCHQPVGWQKDGNTDVLGAEDSVADWSTVIAVTNELTDRMGIEPTAEDIEAELRKRGYTSAASDPDGDIPF